MFNAYVVLEIFNCFLPAGKKSPLPSPVIIGLNCIFSIFSIIFYIDEISVIRGKATRAVAYNIEKRRRHSSNTIEISQWEESTCMHNTNLQQHQQQQPQHLHNNNKRKNVFMSVATLNTGDIFVSLNFFVFSCSLHVLYKQVQENLNKVTMVS